MSDEVFLPFPPGVRAPAPPPQNPNGGAPPKPTAATPQAAHQQDPGYTRVDLPSNYVPYTFKDLYVGVIKGVHQAKFAKAHKLRSPRLVVETVNSLLRGASAFDLTPSDFRWLMYYLRKMNYVKVPLTITAHCSNEDHLLKVASGQLPMSSLENIGTLTSSILEEKPIDMEKVKAAAENPELSTFRLGYPTMKDTMTAVDKDDEEFTWLAELAMCLASSDDTGKPTPLELRVKTVAEMAPEQTEALSIYADAASDYGISETIRMRCKECGAEILEDFQPSAHMFL